MNEKEDWCAKHNAPCKCKEVVTEDNKKRSEGYWECCRVQEIFEDMER